MPSALPTISSTDIGLAAQNYVLLGLVVEQLSGLPIGAYIQNNFITPLNLSQTTYPVDNLTLPDPHPIGYAFYPPNATSGIRDATLYNTLNPNAAGAMISTLQDLKTWVEAMVWRGYGYSSALSQQRLYGPPNLPAAPLPAGISVTYGLGDVSHLAIPLCSSQANLLFPADRTQRLLRSRRRYQGFQVGPPICECRID